MTWVRLGLLAAVVVVAALALLGPITRAPAAPPTPLSAAPGVEATAPAPTRVPLPTLGRQMIISRTAQQTSTPEPSPTRSAVPRVAAIDNGYAPAQLTVASGTAVRWVNSGGDGHDVMGRGPDGAWRSGPLAPGEHYQRAFTIAGTYDYVCSVHPEMRGQVVVQP